MKPGNIKGTAVVDLVKVLRSSRDRALPLLPMRLQDFVAGERRILSSHWYPDDDFMALASAVAEIMPDPGIDRWESMGRFGSRRDFATVYAPLVKAGDPSTTLTFFPAVWQQYHDSGDVRIEIVAPGCANVEVAQYLTEFSTFCRLQAGHIAELLLAAGAKDAAVDVVRVAMANRAARFDATWRM